MRRSLLFGCVLGFVGGTAVAQLPAGHDAALVQKKCTVCHDTDRVMSQRQDADGWQTTVNKMKALGAQIDAAEQKKIVAYLAAAFPAEMGPKLNINQASQVELEAAFSLKRKEAAAVVKYREQVGGFKSVDDLKKAPGMDAKKVDEKKADLTV